MLLQEYYNKTVQENEDGKRWAGLYYGVLTKVINDNGFKNVAEVGIGYGTHAKYLLKSTKLEKLYLIDPMKYYPNDLFASTIMEMTPRIPGNNFNEMHELINNYLSPYNSKYTWLRKESLAVENHEIPDESLDCVFVDGDHSYQAVIADLEFWYKKVRVGGQLLGDDYSMRDVAAAVRDFTMQNNLKYDLLYKPGTSYPIFRLIK